VVCVELVALPLVHGAWITAVATSAANALVLARRIPREEAVLAKDPAWVRAFARVPRLLPLGHGRG
jgi:methyltransferase